MDNSTEPSITTIDKPRVITIRDRKYHLTESGLPVYNEISAWFQATNRKSKQTIGESIRNKTGLTGGTVFGALGRGDSKGETKDVVSVLSELDLKTERNNLPRLISDPIVEAAPKPAMGSSADLEKLMRAFPEKVGGKIQKGGFAALAKTYEVTFNDVEGVVTAVHTKLLRASKQEKALEVVKRLLPYSRKKTRSEKSSSSQLTKSTTTRLTDGMSLLSVNETEGTSPYTTESQTLLSEPSGFSQSKSGSVPDNWYDSGSESGDA